MGIRLGGLASGLDTAALIEAIMGAERRPLALVEQRKTNLEAAKKLFADLGTKLSALRNAAASLDNRSTKFTGASASEEFLAYTAASSDETLLRATATGAAAPGATSVRVVQLAAAARRVSNAFASDTSLIAAAGDTLNLDFGGASPIAITVGAAGASLRDLADLVNADPNNSGEVRAQVVFDGAGYRLLVQASQTGVANNATLSTTILGPGGAAFLDAVAGQDAADAQLEVFGLSITRPSNSVSDVIPGVTFQLIAPSATAAEVQVSRDDDAIATKLETFVSAYNEVVGFMRTNAGFNLETKAAGPLFGDAALRTVTTRLSKVLLDPVAIAGNALSGLVDLGVSLTSDGKLALDRDALTSALDSGALAVREILGGDGVTDGVLVSISRKIDELLDATKDLVTNTTKGLLPLRQEVFDERIEAFDAQIARMERRLEAREKLLVLQFTRMEALLSQLRSQGSALNGLTPTNSNR